MPLESQVLYFHLVLRADDDGVVEAYPVIKLLGTSPDTTKVLIAKSFIRELNEDQVILVNDWLEHNKIRPDRKVDSIYKHLIPPDIKLLQAKPRSDVEDNSKRLNGPSKVGISKVRLGKVRLDIVASDTPPFSFLEEIEVLRTSKRQDFNIIALYWKKKNWVFENHEQFNSALRRELRPAKELSGYSGKEIAKVINYCKNNYQEVGWTLETVNKRIADIVNKK